MEDDQIHPLHDTDKLIIDSLIVKENPDDFDFINLAKFIKSISEGICLTTRASMIFLSIS